MINLAPTVYKIACANCGAISTLPLDILQTKVLCDKPIFINLNEIKWLFFMSTIFAFQNLIYDITYKIPSITLRGALAGLSAGPIYTIFEYKKLKNRLKIIPNFKKFLFWNTLREIILYSIMYNIHASSLKFDYYGKKYIKSPLPKQLKLFLENHS